MTTKYSEEFKNAMIQKMTQPGAKTQTALGAEHGVSSKTLSRWLQERGRVGTMLNNKRRPQDWAPTEKLEAVITYEKLSEAERGKYLRTQGLYTATLEQWKKEILEVLETAERGKKSTRQKDPKDQRIKELEKDLRYKEKALAETAALLVLKKKAQAIWGDREDEK